MVKEFKGEVVYNQEVRKLDFHWISIGFLSDNYQITITSPWLTNVFHVLG